MLKSTTDNLDLTPFSNVHYTKIWLSDLILNWQCHYNVFIIVFIIGKEPEKQIDRLMRLTLCGTWPRKKEQVKIVCTNVFDHEIKISLQ